ncbi:MAG: recombination protein RecR [Candidatus Staskawiczbacteria bacterium]|nr:recombination protein RecR [Candidatus Staskawiczbacteria bacterium]
MDSIKKLTELFRNFPAIGGRTAGRFVFYLINQPKDKIDELIKALQELKNSVKLCSFCFNPFEGEGTFCYICSDKSRNKQVLCVVEKEVDLLSIENTGKYKGFYFVLGGTVTLRNSDGSNLRIKELQNRVKKSTLLEIIIALNTTPEGISTSVLVERTLKELPQFPTLKITHLAKGLPQGGELEYADDETLESAFEGRK